MKTQSNLKSGSLKPKEFKGKIEFKDVRYEYATRPGQEVLKGLKLNIKQNKITAIVGNSGAGKSTISNILMRIYDPT